MNIKNSTEYYIRCKSLNRHGHVRRMKNVEWCPPEKRRKGRSRNSLMEEVTGRITEKGINSMKWIDMEEWR